MPSEFHFEQQIDFAPERAQELLRTVPAAPGVFALCGARAEDEPYLARTADLRRRMARLLAPPEALDAQGRPVLSKRLNLRDRVARIQWTVTGSEFESWLVLYAATAAQFGLETARRRLRLHTPYFIRLTVEHAHPRAYVTNRLSRRGLAQMYGPLPSRAAAERFCDEALDLFKLRRCHEDLLCAPDHPGCVYGEMKKCLRPCQQACTAEDYAAETEAVRSFLATRGAGMLAGIEAEREQASAAMEFEHAATLHAQWQRVRDISALAAEIVQPIPRLRALIVQRAASEGNAVLFLVHGGCISGPEHISTLGIRAVREQTAVGSSLFAQPLMLQPVPLDAPSQPNAAAPSTDAPESRVEHALASLEAQAAEQHSDLAATSDHLSLLRRWYYRPERQRAGEIFFLNDQGSWPIRRILRAAARVVLGEQRETPEAQPNAAKEGKTRTLHAGREGVERVVPVVRKLDTPKV